MNVPLCKVLLHPRLTGTLTDRVRVAEEVLVAEARRLADLMGLTDVAGLLGGASGLAASADWETPRSTSTPWPARSAALDAERGDK